MFLCGIIGRAYIRAVCQQGAAGKIRTLKRESSCGELHNVELRICTFDELLSPLLPIEDDMCVACSSY